jgi:hypothetical protein
MNKSELKAKQWLVENKNLKEEDIFKSKGTPDFLTPIGGFEVKKLYGDKVIFYSDQLDELTRFPDVKVLVFDGDGEFKKEILVSDIDREKGTLGEFRVVETGMITIQVTKSTREQLKSMGKMGDTYDAVIQHLVNGKKPEGGPHGGHEDESTGTGYH